MYHPLLLQMASQQLSHIWQASVRLSEPQLIKRGSRTLIFRCPVATGPSDIPSVILKYICSKPDQGFCEWSSLEFLSQLPNPQGWAPRFYGGNSQAAFVLMADVGPGLRLYDLLTGTDPAPIPPALTQLGTAMARLQRATQGHEAQLQALQQRLPMPILPNRQQEAEIWRFSNQQALWNWLYVTGCRIPSGLATCLQTIAHTYANPGPFLSWTPGDPSPTNHLFANEQAYLLDFEFGGFRHGLYDLCAWPILYPLPETWLTHLIAAFRAQYQEVNDQLFAQHMAHLTAYWGCNLLARIPPHILQADAPWPTGYWHMRPALLAGLSRLSQLSAPWPELAPLATAATTLTKALRACWPEGSEITHSLPPWPVLTPRTQALSRYATGR